MAFSDVGCELCALPAAGFYGWLLRCRGAGLFSGLAVPFDAEFPGSVKSARQRVFICLGEPDMRRTHPAPAAEDGQKQVGALSDKRSLVFGCDRQVAIALADRGECCENVAANAKVGRAHVGAFFCAFEAE